MKKLKQLFVSLGLGAMLLFGAGAAVSAAAEGELAGAVKTEFAEDVILEDYDLPSAKASVPVTLSRPTTIRTVKDQPITLTSITLQWNKISGANGYNVQIKQADSSKGYTDLGIISSTIGRITKILPDTEYCIRVRAVKVNAEKKIIATSNYSAVPVSTKKTSINRVSTDRNGNFTIRMYNPAPSSPADDVLGYRVSFENMKTHSRVNRYYDKSRTGFTFTVKPNYFYKAVITPYVPKTVNGKTVRYYGQKRITHYIAQQPKLAKKGHTATSQTIGWNRVYGATGYKIYVKYPGTTSYKLVKTTTGLSYSLVGINKGKDYLIKVVAFRDKFDSASSTYYRIRL